MAGPGIRSWEFARLLGAEHRVTLAAYAIGDIDSSDVSLESYRNDGDLQKLGDEHEIIITQGETVATHPSLVRKDRVLIVDFYDPLLLEKLHRAPNSGKNWQLHLYRLALSAMNIQARAGDFFLCASEEQKNYWLGQLGAMGRLNPLTYQEGHSFHKLIDIVPFGVSSESPKHTQNVIKGIHPGVHADDKVILWGGGIYEWFDPFTLIRAMARVVAVNPKAKLFFMGARHPNPAVGLTRTAREAMALATELGLLDRHVFFHPSWVPYKDRHNYLLEADIGVSTHFDCVETRFSFRTRILDYIWAGLPIVTTRGDSLSRFVSVQGLGSVVDYEDVLQLTDALLRLLQMPDARTSLQDDFARAAQSMTWERVAEPLLRFCSHPRKAPDVDFLEDPQVAKAIHGAYQSPQSYLGKAWVMFKTQGPVAFAKELSSYLRWRIAGPE
jgi:glycosyltransferase involved in cell wall biosynthesis